MLAIQIWGRAPGQASDYALRAPNPLHSSTNDQMFYHISGPNNQSGPQVFAPLPLSPTLVRIITQEKIHILIELEIYLPSIIGLPSHGLGKSASMKACCQKFLPTTQEFFEDGIRKLWPLFNILREASHIDFVHEKRHMETSNVALLLFMDVFLETPLAPP